MVRVTNYIYILLVANTVLTFGISAFVHEYSVMMFVDFAAFLAGILTLMTLSKNSESSSFCSSPLDSHRKSLFEDSQSVMQPLSSNRRIDMAHTTTAYPLDSALCKEMVKRIPLGVLVLDENLKFESSNLAARRILGLTESREIDSEELRAVMSQIKGLKVRGEMHAFAMSQIIEDLAKVKLSPIAQEKESSGICAEKVIEMNYLSVSPPRGKRFNYSSSDNPGDASPTGRLSLRAPSREGFQTPEALRNSIALEKLEKEVSFLELFESVEGQSAFFIKSMKEFSAQREDIIIDGVFKAENKQSENLIEFEIFGAMNYQHNAPDKVVMTIKDLTKREFISVAEDNSEFKDNLINSFSHELRTPLNQTISSLECARDDTQVPNAAKSSFIVPALRSLGLLLSIIKDIIDLSQLRRRKLHPYIRDFNLKEQLEHCLELVEQNANSKGITCKLTYDEELDDRIHSDRERVCQIVLNLVLNSLKFTPAQGFIHLMAKRTLLGAQISVEDSGRGMTAEQQSRLRQSFENWEIMAKISEESTGAGFGLFLSNQLSLMLSPNNLIGLEVTSKFEKGTLFAFEIENRLYHRLSSASSPGLPPTNKRKLSSSYLKFIDVDHKDLACAQVEKRIPNSYSNISLRKVSCESNPSISGLNYLRAESFEHLSRKSMLETISYQPAEDRAEEDHQTDESECIIVSRQSVRSINAHSNQIKKIPLQEQQRATGGLTASRCQCNPVLIVDDDGMNLAALESLASTFNIKVDKAENGREAVNKYRERLAGLCGKDCQLYKLIIMDLNMPVKNGTSATIIIRSMERVNSLERISIVGCTAYAQDKMSECIEAGMDTCYQKPVTKRDMAEILVKACLKQQAANP